jgi:hypothetical protein
MQLYWRGIAIAMEWQWRSNDATPLLSNGVAMEKQ